VFAQRKRLSEAELLRQKPVAEPAVVVVSVVVQSVVGHSFRNVWEQSAWESMLSVARRAERLARRL